MLRKVQYDKIFLSNFKYFAKLYFPSNFFLENCAFCQINFAKLYFSSNSCCQIALFVKLISPNCTFRRICRASNLNSSNCLSLKSREININTVTLNSKIQYSIYASQAKISIMLSISVSFYFKAFWFITAKEFSLILVIVHLMFVNIL